MFAYSICYIVYFIHRLYLNDIINAILCLLFNKTMHKIEGKIGAFFRFRYLST